MTAVRFAAVSKHFGSRTAVANLTCLLPSATVTGLLGPNGSGKTTTLRLLLNLFIPDSGSIEVFGEAPSHRLSDRIGYLPEERGLYRRMRVRESLRYYSRLKNCTASNAEIEAWLRRFDLTAYRDQRIEQLSKGTAQKVQFIGTILHRPELLILDEPFSGLDPLSRELLREVIAELLNTGVTVLLSTHDMHIAENMCQHFLMLNEGHKVLDGSRQEIGQQFGDRAVKLRMAPRLPRGKSIRNVERILHFGDYQELVLNGASDTQALLSELAQLGSIERFEVSQPSLHDIFLRLADNNTGGEAQASAARHFEPVGEAQHPSYHSVQPDAET